MKKIFTFIFSLFLIVNFVGAQSLTLQYESAELNNGDTVTVSVPQLNVLKEYYLDVTNVSENMVLMKVFKNDMYLLEDATSSICVGGLCYPQHTTESGAVAIPAHTTLGHSTDVENAFHLNYQTPVAGVSYVEFSFVNSEDDEDYVSMVFKLVCDPTNILSTAVATKMNAYPNPASDNVTIEYNHSGNANDMQLVIKNLLGATLFTKKLDVNENRVKVNVSEYNSGIYFYSIEADGRPLITKKLLVK